ncbi:MAG: oligosaccharide flippase family protein [Flavobacteriaceae bacterium]
MIKYKEVVQSLKSLGKDVFILSAGVLIAQLIPFLLQPFLKRTFTPEEFGTYDVYLRSFSILVAISCLKYENAILLPKKDSSAKHIIYLCLISSFVFFILFLVLGLFFSEAIASKFEGFTLVALVLLPVSVLFYTIFNVFNMYLIRRQKFLLSSTNKISRRISEGAVQLVLGLLNNRNGLLIGDVVGNIVQGAFSFWKVWRISPLKYFNTQKLKKLIVEYRDLPIYTLIPNVLNIFVLGSLTFLVLTKFDLKEVGYLEFTQKILSIPSVFISISISQVVFQRISALINKNQKIVPLILSVITILTCIAIFFVIIIEFFGTQIYLLIGGASWESSGEYAKILVYASAFMLIFSPIGKVLIALKKFKINSIWEIGKFLAIIALFFIDGYSLIQYLKLYTIILIVFYIVYGVLILYQSHKYQVENQINN